MLKKVRIQIITDRCEIKGSLFETPTGQYLPVQDIAPEEESQHLELMMEGSYRDDGSCVTISYRESELTGMQGSTTTIFFHKNTPGLISMVRNGTARTALVFEKDKRPLCVYETPVMPFEVAVQTRHVHNTLEKAGKLYLDYTVELRGANAEHTRFYLTLLPAFDKPLS